MLTMKTVMRSKESGVVKLAPGGGDQDALFLGRRSRQVFQLDSRCPRDPTKELDLERFQCSRDV